MNLFRDASLDIVRKAFRCPVSEDCLLCKSKPDDWDPHGKSAFLKSQGKPMSFKLPDEPSVFYALGVVVADLARDGRDPGKLALSATTWQELLYEASKMSVLIAAPADVTDGPYRDIPKNHVIIMLVLCGRRREVHCDISGQTEDGHVRIL